MRRSLRFAVLVFVVLLTRSALANNPDFPHGLVSVQSVYPTEASVMQQIKLQAQALVGGMVSGGAFQTNFAGDDISDDQWGAVALLAYWWYFNGQNAETAIPGLLNSTPSMPCMTGSAGAAQQGLSFAIANRDFIADPVPPDNENVSQYLLIRNSGQHYAKNHLDDTEIDANYEETALTLVYKAMILQYGQGLFCPNDLATVKTQAYSHWTWFTTVSAYNPELTANQVMIGIVGGYWLGKIYNDQSLMTQAVNYYNVGVAGTNNTQGYRNTDRITTSQGYSYFTEHRLLINGVVQLEGFDTHYSGLQLSDMAEMVYLMGGPSVAGNIYTDALAETVYSSDRLSEAGSMHGGTRHNEVGSTTSDISPGAGYNYFGSILQADLGRVTVTNASSTGSGHVQTWGHPASEIIFLDQTFPTTGWVTNPLPANDLASMRSNNVSIFFDELNQPQEISVAGTVLTDALHNAAKAQGLDIRNSSNVRSAPATMSPPTFDQTQNYTLHTTTGSVNNADLSAGVRHYFVTDGTVLYIVTLVQVNAPCSSTQPCMLDQLGNLLGVPNISSVNRIVNVNDATTLNSVLDFSQDSGSYTSTALQTGDVRMDAWPQIVAENVAPNGTTNTWMTVSTNETNPFPTWNQTLEQLGNASTQDGANLSRIYYYPNSNTPCLTTTDDIRVGIQPTTSATAYVAGDLMASVVRIAPTANTTHMTVTPVTVNGSSFKISQITVSDPGMSFQLSWNNVSFTDLRSGQVINSPERLNQSITAAIPSHTYGDAPFTLAGAATSGLPVTFSLVSGPASLSGSTLTLTGAGTVVVQTNQAGNNSYQAVSTPVSFNVAGAPLALTAANASIVYGSSLPTFTGTINGVLNNDPVTETFSANTPTTTPVPAGSYTITPSTTGSAAGNYTATVHTGTLTVGMATPTLSLTSSNPNSNAGASIILTAHLQLPSGVATGTVNFMDGNTLLGSSTAFVGNVTFTTSALAAGSHSLTAVYSGDTDLNTVTSASITQAVTAPVFQFSATTAAALTLSLGQSGTVSFSLPSAGSYAHTVTFSSSGLPADVTAQFAPPSLTFTGANDTKTMAVTFTRSATASLLPYFGLRAGGILSAWILMPLLLRRRKTWPALLSALLLWSAVTACITISGCGGGTTPPASSPTVHTVQITAADGTTTLSTPITLTLP